MALEPIQQLEKLILTSKNILILLPQNPNGDAIGSGWAFNFFLQKKNIETAIAFIDRSGVAIKFDFLEKPDNIVNEISGARDFVLAFNTRYNKIIDTRTERKEEEFRIYITPEHGSIDPRDFSFIPAKFKYDLVVVLGSPDKESLGKIYEDNPDIFYEIPVVNIDHHSNNENYAQVNIVSMNASSTSEILADILEQINTFSMDENIAECLLTGIISATESFQRKNTTPKSLQIAAKLMDKGADQQKIVRFLYKTQSFNMLKLWGRVMSRVKWDNELKLVWAQVFIDDFVQSRTSPTDLPLILEKIKDNYSIGKKFMLLYNETADKIGIMFKSSNIEEDQKIAHLLGGEFLGDTVSAKIENMNLNQAEEEILKKLKVA